LNFGNVETAILFVMAIIFGGILRNVSEHLWNRWTKHYVEKEEFEEFKKELTKKYILKEHYDKVEQKIQRDIEELKTLVIIVAAKLKIDLSKIHLKIPADVLKEILKEEKYEEKIKNKD